MTENVIFRQTDERSWLGGGRMGGKTKLAATRGGRTVHGREHRAQKYNRAAAGTVDIVGRGLW